MQEAVPVGEGAMIAVLGLKIDEVNNFIKNRVEKEGICEIANDNAEGQVIISGSKKTLEDLQASFKEKKIKSIPLKVSAPFHCSLMRKAADNMRGKIDNVKFSEPLIEIVNNVTANKEKNPEIIKKLLVEQIYSTVKWRESILYLTKKGVKNFIEIGPGKVLTGMIKRTIKESNCFSLNSIADIKNFIDEFKK